MKNKCTSGDLLVRPHGLTATPKAMISAIQQRPLPLCITYMACDAIQDYVHINDIGDLRSAPYRLKPRSPRKRSAKTSRRGGASMGLLSSSMSAKLLSWASIPTRRSMAASARIKLSRSVSGALDDPKRMAILSRFVDERCEALNEASR